MALLYLLHALHTYLPQPPLSRFVSLFWHRDGYVPQPRKERVLPTGTVELVRDLRESATRIYDFD